MLKVILNRLKTQAEDIIAEEQAGFRAERSTTDLRILCEKYLIRQQNLYRVFIDKNRVRSITLTEYGMQPYGPPCGSTISVQI